MVVSSDEITIDLSDDDVKTAPATEVQVTEPPKKPKSDPIRPDDGIAKLQEDLANERRLREDAERRAAEASQAEVKAKTEVQGTQLDLVKNAINQFTASNDQLEAQYAAALGDQDFQGAAKLQRQMVANQAKITELERTKASLEKAPKPAPSVPPDLVEHFVRDLTPESAKWVRQHPEFARDPAKTRKMVRAHEDAVDAGVKVDTPEYFAYVENRLGLGSGDMQRSDDALSDASQAKSSRSAPPASAPVTRSGNGASPRSNIVTLTAEEREMAKNMDMTDQEYARYKLQIKREGMN